MYNGGRNIQCSALPTSKLLPGKELLGSSRLVGLKLIYVFCPSQPKILVLVGSMFRAARKTYGTDFANLFSPVMEVQHDYVDGFLVIGTFFLVLFVFWALLLIVLKIKGREVGCASGQAFHKEGSGDDGSCLESTDSSESYSSNSMESGVENEGMDRLQTNIDEQSSRQGSSSFDQHYEEENDYDSQEGWLSIEDVPSRKSVEGVPSRKRINQREQRTRFCFIFFSFVALICVTCILVFSFGPMKEAARTSEDILLVSYQDFFFCFFIFC